MQRQSVSVHTRRHKPSSYTTFLLNSHWGRAAQTKKEKKSWVYACRVTSVVSNSLQPCRLWPAGGFSRQEYWNVLANTGFHTLLEYYISCWPSCQLPWVPGAARTPVTQAAAPPPHLVLTAANPSPPGQPQEKTPVDDPHSQVKIKP